jgi:hypothetical protein
MDEEQPVDGELRLNEELPVNKELRPENEPSVDEGSHMDEEQPVDEELRLNEGLSVNEELRPDKRVHYICRVEALGLLAKIEYHVHLRGHRKLYALMA